MKIPDKLTFLKAIFWFVLSLLTSSFNDALMKGLAQELPNIEIIFCRFLFGTISLIPFMVHSGNPCWKKEDFYIHGARGVLLFVGMILWCYGLKNLPLATAAVLGFTVPLFTLPLAFIFLGESIHWSRWIATVVGFGGISIVLIPTAFHFSWFTFALTGAAFFFALLDIINKKVVARDNLISMLFYSALATTILSACPACLSWKMPTFQQFCLLIASGIGANLIIYCLLKAFQASEASLLAPFRYFEFILSIIFGYIFFQELPTFYTLLGAAIIIPAILFIVLYEFHKAKDGVKIEQKEKPNRSSGEFFFKISPKILRSWLVERF